MRFSGDKENSPMRRNIAIVGAPSSIGIRPYDDNGKTRQLDQAPGVLRELDLVRRLGAIDLGDVLPPAYRDYIRPPGRMRNEAELIAYSGLLARRVTDAISNRQFALVLGGDCSIVLACLAGARQSAQGSVGLAYIDAHADFALPEESVTGSAASMSLSLAVGRGDTPLARLAGDGPFVREKNVVLIGRRDFADSWYGHAALAASPILDIPGDALGDRGIGDVAADALRFLTSDQDLSGFWIHLDADVINPSVMPAVDSPEAGGPTIDEVVDLLAPLVHHPQALGLELTIYDPGLDTDHTCAGRLVTLLEKLLVKGAS
jgi:arginase